MMRLRTNKKSYKKITRTPYKTDWVEGRGYLLGGRPEGLTRRPDENC
jgi:hypothetical protein